MERKLTILSTVTATVTLIVAVIAAVSLANQILSVTLLNGVVVLAGITASIGGVLILVKAQELRKKRILETSDADRFKEILKLIQDLQADHFSNANSGRENAFSSPVRDTAIHGITVEQKSKVAKYSEADTASQEQSEE